MAEVGYSDPVISSATTTLIDTVPAALAKDTFGPLLSEVVHQHRPKVVEKHGRDPVLFLGQDEILMLLEDYKFHPKIAVSEGEFIIRLPEFGLIAGGATLDEAYDELVELSEVYAHDFVSRWLFFRETDRRDQMRWILRFAMTPPDHRRALFSERTADASAAVPA